MKHLFKQSLPYLCILFFIITIGCGSIRYKSSVSKNPNSTIKNNIKFKIKNVNYNIFGQGMQKQLTDTTVASALNQGQLMNTACKMYPNIFSHEDTALPIEIDASVEHSDNLGVSVLLEICTLAVYCGIIPCDSGIKNKFSLNYQIDDNYYGSILNTSSNFTAESDMWISVLSPFALIPIPGKTDLPKDIGPFIKLNEKHTILIRQSIINSLVEALNSVDKNKMLTAYLLKKKAANDLRKRAHFLLNQSEGTSSTSDFDGHIKNNISTNKQFRETSNSFRKEWAVVVGLSDYKYSGKDLNNLIYADDDAEIFARTLQNNGWKKSRIKLLTNNNAKKGDIEEALEGWLTKAGPEDLILIFWAGHGYPDPNDSEKIYLACFDTNLNKPWTGVRMDKLTSSIKELKSKNVIVIADTCHAGKLITRGKRGLALKKSFKKLSVSNNIPKGWIFMVSADTDREAIEHSAWGNGAFTHCLIDGLSGKADGFESVGKKNGIVTMREIRAYLNSSMPDETQRVLGKARHPIITTTSGDPTIWDITLNK